LRDSFVEEEKTCKNRIIEITESSSRKRIREDLYEDVEDKLFKEEYEAIYKEEK
jgi:hypothetical protein